MRKIIIVILALSLLVSLYGIYLFNVNNKYIELLPDFYRNINTVDFVSENWYMPSEIEFIPGSSEKGIMDHQPLYYYFASMLLKITKDLDKVIVLQVFSVLMIFLTNIIFYFLLKKIFKEARIQIYSLVLFSFFPLHLYVSMFIGPDPLFYLLFISFLYFFFVTKDKKNMKSALILGIFLGLTLLTRVYGIVLITSLFLYVLYLHFKKSKDRNLFLTSVIVGGFLGAYGILRNYFVFGNLLASIPAPVPSDINTFIRLFNSFWSGVFGGLESIKILIGICVIILLIMFLFSFVKHFKILNRYDIYLLLVIICFLTLLQIFNLQCNFLEFIQNFRCGGDAGQNRYLIPFEVFLALGMGFGLNKLENRKVFKYLTPMFIIICCILFAVDFIYALK